MSQNIKNNLFRFVTLRSPQLIDEKDKQLGFIYHPDEQSGEFFTAIDAASESEKKQAILDTRATFINSSFFFQKKSDVKDFTEGLYNFSSWLMRNKNALSYAEIKDNISEAVELTAAKNIIFWDNLIYQTVNKSSVYVREALIQLLIANKFLTHFNAFAEQFTDDSNVVFTDEDEKKFKRLAFASVVISKKVLLETYSGDTGNTKPKSKNYKHQERLSDLLTLKYDMEALKRLKNELVEAQKAYKTLESTNYKTGLDNHQSSVDAILDNGTLQLVNQWDVETQAYIQVEKLIHDPLPTFSYQKSLEISTNNLQTKLSELSYKYFLDNKLDKLSSYDSIIKTIKTLSKEKSNKVDKLLPKTSKSIIKGGVHMRVDDPFASVLNTFGDTDSKVEQMIENGTSVDEIPLFVVSEIDPKQIDPSSCYTLNIVAQASARDNEGNRLWSFKAGVTYNNEFVGVTAVDQSLSFTNDANLTTSSNFLMEQTSINHLKIGFFSDLGSISKNVNVGNPILSGTITLANGDALDFAETIEMQPLGKGLIGNQQLDFDCIEDEEAPTETPSTFGKIYGVTNLGIADFRRVEQEVCCYVPGEVSHIENVMAREYKERSTRSLTSSEFTTEQTDERERENLTDTTSTERNEMQSEVASVLNEDQSQSYGGNANVSSTFGGSVGGSTTFSAGAYFDSASSSSSSNSNTQAQTYAQEVTERAMERVVQKTQTKRTSRILKEFEENTSHGFDNRKGENHVTGVYRWVDKIYKNKLINYGKRLMYEFAIPEPSKFFQEAVWKDIDETGKTENGIILPGSPEHPDTIVDNIENIDETNYLELAEAYGIELPIYPEEEKYIGKGYGFYATTIQGDRYEVYGEGTELDIPDGYYAFEATAVWTHSSDNSEAAPVKAVVGNIKVATNGQYEEVDKYTDSIPVSYSALSILSGNINFSVKLCRSEEYLSTWKNEVYSLALEAYEEKLDEYNEAMQAYGIIPEGSAEKLTFNPLQNKSIMLRELKRVAIELLIDQNRVSRDNFEDPDEVTGISLVKRDEAFQTHASTVKFFEQAFDWDIMAYVFYPYFYAHQDDWKKLFQSQDAADPLFQAFLQSGMARTVVPVRPGFEDAVNWYMTTGEIWNGQGLVIDQDDDLYISVAEEMQTVEGEVEGTWETRLPTALTILQAGSIGLNVEGLPCNMECDDNLLFDTDGNPVLDENGQQVSIIDQTDTLIGGDDGVATGGVGSDVVGEVITVQ